MGYQSVSGRWCRCSEPVFRQLVSLLRSTLRSKVQPYLVLVSDSGQVRLAGLEVAAPEQGLHLVAELPPGTDDVSLAKRAKETGFGAKALSPLYLGVPARRGLVIGFSGFPPEVMADAARRFLRSLG